MPPVREGAPRLEGPGRTLDAGPPGDLRFWQSAAADAG